MASVSASFVGGGIYSASPAKARSVAATFSGGTAFANARVAWAGSVSPLERVPWIPRAGTRAIDPRTGVLNPVWDNAIRYLFEQVIGGILAPTLPQVSHGVIQTQEQAVALTTHLLQVESYAAGIAATAESLREVAQNNGLTGAGSVPDIPERPRFGSEVQ